jgi:hypothetical protein
MISKVVTLAICLRSSISGINYLTGFEVTGRTQELTNKI